MKPHLLPMHYRLGRLLGMRPEDVKRFYWEAAKKAAEGPQPAVVAGEPGTTLAIIALEQRHWAGRAGQRWSGQR